MRNPVQTTDTVLMVKPAAFGYNEETSVNNHFQTKSGESDIPERARQACCSDAGNITPTSVPTMFIRQ